MLEPDLTKNNCSIIVKNIRAEDKKEYVLRLEESGRNTYNLTVKITIQDEPKMEVPLLSEGQEANLTCSAPFPCPETPPEITWRIKTREGNIPDEAKPINVQWNECNKKGNCKNEIFNLRNVKEERVKGSKVEKKEIKSGRIEMLEPDLTKNNCSIIVKNIRAEDKKEYVLRLEESGRNTYNLTVKITIQDEPKMEVPLLSEGQEANLTCSAPFPCPETPPEITWWIKTRGENITDLKDNIILTISKSLYLSTLTLTPTSDLHNATVACEVSYGSKNINTSRTLKVMYVKSLQILGNDKVTEGDTLSLSCTVESHPPSSDPVWSFSGITNIFMNQTSTKYLTANVRKQHAGVYSCMRTYRNKTLNASITIDVIRDTNELKVNKSFSPGSKNMPLNNTTKSTGNTENLHTADNVCLFQGNYDFANCIEDFIKNLNVSTILTFVVGMVCSALIFSMALCCWVSCHRGKHKVPTANPDTEVDLEMVQTDGAQTGTNEQTPLSGQLNGGNPNTAEPTDRAEVDEAVGMEAGEVDYASIDYSLLKDRVPEEGEMEPTDTDYAEIKRDRRGDGKEREVLQDGDDQIETSNQMDGDEELYSNSQELKS
ncbi:sialic acid-binding Ig-like lectin 8 [Sinocyclocheilus anshuiensis]|uniref:sialic acid-binding Ig-like lectin 8 n=1 Tax=Sinocyclocheilus anshuiensis TaxID=1608454 RepID=UPI0007B7BA19|nr:PREDICTED: sialic acid-binding Ig-like lectin 8 [Sinocyclocheilus anshuiensis]